MKKLTPAQLKALTSFANGSRGGASAVTVYALLRLGLIAEPKAACYTITDAGMEKAVELGLIAQPA